MLVPAHRVLEIALVALAKKGNKSGALFGGLSTCAGLVKSCKDLTVIRSQKPKIGILPWISAAVLGGALLVGVPAGLLAFFGSPTVEQNF